MRQATEQNRQIESFRRGANTVLLAWILCGMALMLAWPAARGYSEWVGHWPFWLLGAPLSALMALHRERIALALRRPLRRPAPHARGRRRRQARRAAQTARPSGALRASLAALLPG